MVALQNVLLLNSELVGDSISAAEEALHGVRFSPYPVVIIRSRPGPGRKK